MCWPGAYNRDSSFASGLHCFAADLLGGRDVGCQHWTSSLLGPISAVSICEGASTPTRFFDS